jgi:hypothetical protein
MILSDETLLYPAVYYCLSPLIHTYIILSDVLYRYIIVPFGSYYVYTVHIYVHTILSDDESVVSPTRRAQQLEQTCLTIYFFFFLFWCGFILHLFLVAINTYLYNMILSEETLRYPAAYCCPSPLIHTCTI